VREKQREKDAPRNWAVGGVFDSAKGSPAGAVFGRARAREGDSVEDPTP